MRLFPMSFGPFGVITATPLLGCVHNLGLHSRLLPWFQSGLVTSITVLCSTEWLIFLPLELNLADISHDKSGSHAISALASGVIISATPLLRWVHDLGLHSRPLPSYQSVLITLIPSYFTRWKPRPMMLYRLPHFACLFCWFPTLIQGSDVPSPYPGFCLCC